MNPTPKDKMTQNQSGSYTGLIHRDAAREIDIRKLYIDSEITVDLYIQSDDYCALYVKKGTWLDKNRITKLLANRHNKMFILREDRETFENYVVDNLSLKLNETNIDSGEKVGFLHSITRNIIEDVFTDPRSGAAISTSRKVIGHTIEFLYRDQKSVLDLIKLQKNDNYTYTHSVNVSIFLIALARELGITDREKLVEIGHGGLLHDLGKSDISQDIINKPKALNEDEWKLMRQHPQIGVNIARASGSVSDLSLLIIGQHHEHQDGSGYPMGLKGSILSLYSNMASIVDIYDAITTRRSYSPADTPGNAVRHLLSKENKFNQRILKQFIALLGIDEQLIVPKHNFSGNTVF